MDLGRKQNNFNRSFPLLKSESPEFYLVMQGFHWGVLYQTALLKSPTLPFPPVPPPSEKTDQ